MLENCSLSPDLIKNTVKTNIFGKTGFYYFDEIDSTNTYAITLAEKGSPEGTVVLSENQQSGRGRLDRVWYSPDKEGIYMSIIMRPDISTSEFPLITLMTSLALKESLNVNGINNIKIKWPNDITINGKKAAGILSEMNFSGSRLNFAVVGIGLNVNNPFHTIPYDISGTATSLYIETEKIYDRDKIVCSILELFEKYYDTMKSQGVKKIIDMWKEMSGFLGTAVKIRQANLEITGMAESIDEKGHVLIRDEEGLLHQVISGDIEILSWPKC